MSQNEYPRPEYTSGVYPKDKTWGIVIIVLSALGLCGSIALGGLGAVVGAGGASAAAGAANTAEGRDAAAAVGASGGLLAILGLVLGAMCLVQLVGGIGIMKSLKWGFLVVGGFAAISLILNIVHLNPIGLVINGIFLYYCFMRMTGKMGPVPT